MHVRICKCARLSSQYMGCGLRRWHPEGPEKRLLHVQWEVRVLSGDVVHGAFAGCVDSHHQHHMGINDSFRDGPEPLLQHRNDRYCETTALSSSQIATLDVCTETEFISISSCDMTTSKGTCPEPGDIGAHCSLRIAFTTCFLCKSHLSHK